MRPRHPHPHPPPQLPPTTVHSATFRLTLALARRWRCIRCIRCCSALSEYHGLWASGAAGGGGRPAAVAHVRWPREGGRAGGREGARARGRQIWRAAGGRRAKRCEPHLVRVACWRRMNLRRKLRRKLLSRSLPRSTHSSETAPHVGVGTAVMSGAGSYSEVMHVRCGDAVASTVAPVQPFSWRRTPRERTQPARG